MIDPESLLRYLAANAARGAEILKAVQNEPDTDALSDVCALAWASTVLEELTRTRADLPPEHAATMAEVLAAVKADARDTARDYRAQFCPGKKDMGLN
jgi:hypothetical protein